MTRTYDMTVGESIQEIVNYNWRDEENDYNHEALEQGNSRDRHIFTHLMRVQQWLEETFGYEHVEPRVRCATCGRMQNMPTAPCTDCGDWP